METNTTMAGDPPPKKKPTPVAGYKAMVKKPNQALAADTTKPLSPTNPLMVEKADGSIGQWGNPIPPNKPAPVAVKKTVVQSDKARGYSSSYYTPNH